MKIRKFGLAALTVAIAMPLTAEADNGSKAPYVPQIHGTVRARYELATDGWSSRFQVRNARLSVSGGVCPIVDYYVQADFCDCGSFKMLDAWAGVKATRWLKFQAGQQRMPFSVDASRSPHNYYFANRSFIGKQVGNVRAVGIKGSALIPGTMAYIEAGIFNTHGLSNHKSWERTFNYSAKAGYVFRNVKAEVGMESVRPDSVRANLWDVSLSWNCGRWMVEGEYTSKHFVNDRFRTCHAYNVMADYHLPLEKGVFNRLSFQGRWDGMTDHSSGVRNSAGELYCTDHGRNRITVGSTISYIKSGVRADIRLNYEKYLYQHGYKAAQGEGDKITVELVVRF